MNILKRVLNDAVVSKKILCFVYHLLSLLGRLSLGFFISLVSVNHLL